MAIIARPNKTTGFPNYASGSTTILAAEVDSDLNTVYTDHNGNITNANIAGAANIATSKVAQDGGIVTAHLASNSVTNVKMADNAINTAELAALAVTAAKLAVNATMVNFVSVAVPSFSGIVTPTETQLFTLPSFTPRSTSSRIFFFGSIAYFLNTASVSGTQAILRIRRGVAGTVVDRVDYELQSPSTSAHDHPLPTPFIVDTTPNASATIYEVTGQVNTVGTLNSTTTASRGTFYAVEFA